MTHLEVSPFISGLNVSETLAPDVIMPDPAVSVIIPSLNRATVLRSTIAQFCNQPFQDFEIWVIDQSDASDHAANAGFFAEIADKRLNYLHITARGPSNARNEGLARARGEIVLFVDDDVLLLTQDFIRAHLRVYEDPRIGGVTGRHVERMLLTNVRHTACHVAWNGRTIFNLFGNKRVRIGSCKGSNMSVRMAAIRRVGGFDRRLKFLEETDFSTRIRNAGWELVFEPEAEVLHLSAPAGGVREKDLLQAEIVRFECTAYYMLRHRGAFGAAAFIITFLLIAVQRAVRFRRAQTIPILVAAMVRGFATVGLGPDCEIPSIED